jgi:hypothetical protein
MLFLHVVFPAARPWRLHATLCGPEFGWSLGPSASFCHGLHGKTRSASIRASNNLTTQKRAMEGKMPFFATR